MLVCLLTQAQYKYDYTWAFGYDCCNGDEIDNFVLNFNDNKLKIDTVTLQEEFFRAGQICDKNGELALYTKGCKLYNGKNQVLINGDSLIQSDSMPYGCLPHGRQGIVMLPDAYNEDLVWIFYKSAFIRKKPLPGANLILDDAFRYSLVNKAFHFGRGEVIQKNIAIVHDTALVYGDITATKHANNKDWWIITATDKSDLNYYIVLLDPHGINEIKVQKIGNKIKSLGNDSDGFIFSPDGSKLARFFYQDGLFLFDFDRQTGILSNFRNIKFANQNSVFGGLAFSPSGRFLYIATDTILYQYDFLETDSLQAMIEIDYFDYFRDVFYTTFYTAQLGPDCKIYLATNGGSRYLHVIKYPDNKGKSCGFVQHGIKLPFYNDNYMPYFPNYRLGYAPVCDSTIDFITGLEFPVNSVFTNIFPNPTFEQIHLEIELSNQSNVHFLIQDLNSKQVFKAQLDQTKTKYIFDIHDLTAGIYIFYIQSNEGILKSGKLVKL
ncbi:MAG: T9SS type A sorting domain-containing protein [Saprospiraceae bacterium]|nr:T9SS type A sorting domain-containing protein [Saprospiraceae bacterium]